MKRIKSFKIFESVDDDGKLDIVARRRLVDNGDSIRRAIRENDFENFKDLVKNSGKESKLVLKNSAEYGRVEFVSYLLDLYDYTQSDVDEVSNWIKHSRKNPEGSIECLELIRNKTGLNITNYEVETDEYKPKTLPSDGDRDYTRLRKNLRTK